MRHFWLRNSDGFPVACVASTLLPDSNVAFAIAITNPKDIFNRKRGREIAVGRLTKEKPTATIIFGSDKTPVKHAIMEAIRDNDQLPKRVRSAAVLWLIDHPIDANRATSKAPPIEFTTATPSEPPPIEVTTAPEETEALNRIFTGVHEREERPFRFSDAPTEDEAWNDSDA